MIVFIAAALFVATHALDLKQSDNHTPASDGASLTPATPERWNIYYQATSIGQYHGTFHSPYEGPLSLQDHPEKVVSLTSTLFFGFRLAKNTQFAAFDLQHVQNPAYNRDRGPVWVPSIRLHLELSKQ